MNSSIISITYLVWVLAFFFCRINAKPNSKLLIKRTLPVKSPVLAAIFVSGNENAQSIGINILGFVLYILWSLLFVVITLFSFVIPQTQIAASVITFSDSPLYFNTINDRLILYITPAFVCIAFALFLFNRLKMFKSKAVKCIFIILSALLIIGAVALTLLSVGIL